MLMATIPLSKMATPNRAVIIESGLLARCGGSWDGNSLAGHSVRRADAVEEPRICRGGRVDAGTRDWRKLCNLQRGGCAAVAPAPFSAFGPSGQYLANGREPRNHERYDVSAGISRMARSAEIIRGDCGLENSFQISPRRGTSGASLGRRSFIGVLEDARRQAVSRQGFSSR